MTRGWNIATGLGVVLVGAAVIFTTGACHRHHHGHHHHGDPYHDHHHYKGDLEVENASAGAAIVEGATPVELAPGEAATLELADGYHDVAVTYEDGGQDAYFDLAVAAGTTTGLDPGA